MTDIQSLFHNICIQNNNLSIEPLTSDKLTEIANWPKYLEKELAWANFSATTKDLQKRWYRSSIMKTRAWFVIYNREEFANQILGRTSLSQPINGSDLIFGLVLRPDKVNMGIGTQATGMVVKMVLEKTNYDGVWLESHLENHRARRVWEKIGFELQSFHYRRNNYGNFEKVIGYRFSRSDKDKLPEINISLMNY